MQLRRLHRLTAGPGKGAGVADLYDLEILHVLQQPLIFL